MIDAALSMWTRPHLLFCL